MDGTYTNGVIAVKEKSLLGDRLKRLSECGAEEAFRQIAESGFGYGAEASSAGDYEKLVEAEERSIDEFIRTYAPSRAEKSYLFTPRDFHNAEALVKARFLSIDPESMLAGEGNIPVAVIENAVQNDETEALGILGGAIKAAVGAFQNEEHAPAGAEIGNIFVRAQFEALKKECAANKTVKALLAAKADTMNILTAFRAPDYETATQSFVVGGTLGEKQLSAVFADAEKCERAFERSPYLPFVRACLEAKRSALPFTEPERMAANYEITYFNRNRFSLNASGNFLYYVFRRRLECADVRILFVCLRAGLSEGEIKKRLRSLREGL